MVAALMLVGCASPGPAGSAGSGSVASSASVPSTTTPPESSPSPPNSSPPNSSPPNSSPPNSSPPNSSPPNSSPPNSSPSLPSSATDDWAALQAALAAADAELPAATAQGWWAGPVCSPDIQLHRENAGQPPLPDEQLRADCAANIAQFWASGQDYRHLLVRPGQRPTFERRRSVGSAAHVWSSCRRRWLSGHRARPRLIGGQAEPVHPL